MAAMQPGQPIRVTIGGELKQTEADQELGSVAKHFGYSSLIEIEDQIFHFDMSSTYWYDLGALLWFITLLNRLKARGNQIQLILPGDQSEKARRAWSFLLRWRFFTALRSCVDDPVNLLPSDQLSHLSTASKYAFARTVDPQGQEMILHSLRVLEIDMIAQRGKDHSTESDSLTQFLQRYKDRVLIGALASLCGWEGEQAREFVQIVISEGIENSMHHARGTFSLVSMKIDPRYLTLAIADNGVGIPDVLRPTLQRWGRDELAAGSDAELIEYFAEPQMILDSHLINASTRKGVSSDPTRHGAGLFYLKDRVLRAHGELRVRSGRACVTFTPSDVQPQDNLLRSPGTTLRVLVPRRKRRRA